MGGQLATLIRDSYAREAAERFIANSPVVLSPRRDGYIEEIELGLDGNVVVSGGTVNGTATGRENPEAIVDFIRIEARPAGEIFKLDPRGIMFWRLFDRGRAIQGTDLSGAAGTFAQALQFPIPFALPSLRKPFESALNTKRFDSIDITIQCADQTRLLTGNDRTWDFNGLRFDPDVSRNLSGLPISAGQDTHLLRQFQIQRQISAAQSDFRVRLPGGFLYKELLVTTEDAFVLVDGINRAIVQGGGITPYDKFEADIKRYQRRRVPDAAVSDTGLYLIDLCPSGMVSRCFDARGLSEGVDLLLDVDAPAGTRFVNVYARAIIPNVNLL